MRGGHDKGKLIALATTQKYTREYKSVAALRGGSVREWHHPDARVMLYVLGTHILRLV